MAQKGERTRGANARFVRTVATAEREAKAAALRSQGMTYRQIATELGCNVKDAHKDVQSALRAIVQEPAEDVRRIELDRLDALYAKALGVLERQHITVSNGRVVSHDGSPVLDDGPALQAIDRCLRVMERRAKLLGLDAPSKVSVDAENLGQEIGALLSALTSEGGDDGTGADT